MRGGREGGGGRAASAKVLWPKRHYWAWRGAGDQGRVEQASPLEPTGDVSLERTEPGGCDLIEKISLASGRVLGRGKCGAELGQEGRRRKGETWVAVARRRQDPLPGWPGGWWWGAKGASPPLGKLLHVEGALPGAAPGRQHLPPLFAAPRLILVRKLSPGAPPAGGAPSAHAQPLNPDRRWRALCACPARDPRPTNTGGAPSAHAQPRTPFYGRRALCACPAKRPLPAGGAVSELFSRPPRSVDPRGLGVFVASWGGQRGSPLWPYARGPSPVCADSEIKVALGFPNAFLSYLLTEN